jgi:hypothetical protein
MPAVAVRDAPADNPEIKKKKTEEMMAVTMAYQNSA